MVSFDDSGITVRGGLRVADVKNKFVAKSQINMLIWKAFKRNNIDIPFPQMDVHVKNPASFPTKNKNRNKR